MAAPLRYPLILLAWGAMAAIYLPLLPAAGELVGAARSPAHWRALFADPQLGQALAATLVSTLLSVGGALLIALTIAAWTLLESNPVRWTQLRLLLSSRQMPLLELQELDAAMDLKRCELSGADEAAFDRLVTRRGAAEDPAEQELADQLARNRRVLEQLTQLDRRVSEKLCRERSIYRRDET